MKKCWMILLVALLLSGCGAEQTFETVGDAFAEPVSAPAQQIVVELPDSAQAPAMQSEDAETIYFCEDLTVSVQTLASGDLERTLQTATGYPREALQLMQSYAPEGKCYECVWTSTGEGEMQVGRTQIIDDGSFHYVLTVTVPEGKAGDLQEQIQSVMDSFRVVDQQTEVNTGS